MEVYPTGEGPLLNQFPFNCNTEKQEGFESYFIKEGSTRRSTAVTIQNNALHCDIMLFSHNAWKVVFREYAPNVIVS